MQGNASHQQSDSGERLPLLFIIFCIACVALTGAFLIAYVYMDFQ